MSRLRLLSNGHARKDTLPALAYGTHVLSLFGRSFTPRCPLYSRPPRSNYYRTDQLTAQATSTSTSTSNRIWTHSAVCWAYVLDCADAWLLESFATARKMLQLLVWQTGEAQASLYSCSCSYFGHVLLTSSGKFLELVKGERCQNFCAYLICHMCINLLSFVQSHFKWFQSQHGKITWIPFDFHQPSRT